MRVLKNFDTPATGVWSNGFKMWRTILMENKNEWNMNYKKNNVRKIHEGQYTNLKYSDCRYI